ncbi:hypothetical protein AGLY_013342, partial [Aphis glycines]
ATFKKQPSSPTPLPPTPLILQQQPPSQPPKQRQQLTVPRVANCVMILNKQIKHNGEKSINEKTNVKPPVERKINKEEREQRLNARIRRLVSPKSPLMVYNELFGDIPILLQPHHGDEIDNTISYTATLEIDGQMYSVNDISKTQAKQKACQLFFRNMLEKQMNEQSEKYKESPKIEVGESKSKGPSPEVFPWSHLASLAIDNLINQWVVKPVVT